MKVLKMNLAKLSFAIALVAFSLTMSLQPSQASPNWSVQFGSQGDETPTAMILDTDGNIYVIGCTTGNLYGTNAGGEDIFLAKYNSSGTFVWGKQLGTSADDCANAVSVDTSGNIYLAGTTSGSLFATNGGQENQNTDPTDAFIVKFNSSGTQLWGKQFGTNTSDGVSSIALDNQSNIVIAGLTQGNLFGTNAGYDNDPALAYGTEDIFLCKYTPIGTLIWSQQYGQAGGDTPAQIRIDSQNNIILNGDTYEMFSAPVSDPAGADAHGMLAKYSSSGVLLWGMQANGSNSNQVGLSADRYNSLALDSLGSIITSGGIEQIDSIQGLQSYIAKYSTTGKLIWENLITSYDANHNIEGANVSQVAIDSQSSVIAVGVTYGSLFAPNIGGQDNFVAKYNSSGSLIWSSQYGTSSNDELADVCVDTSGNIYVLGRTEGDLFATNVGGYDIFIQKLSPTGQMASPKPPRPAPYKPLVFAWAGKNITLRYPPVLINKQPYVYVGYLSSGIPGAKVRHTSSHQVVIEGLSKQVCITPGTRTYQINGKSHIMSAKPVVVSNQCYVPLDVMKAVLPYPVHYEVKAQTVHFDPLQRKQARN